MKKMSIEQVCDAPLPLETITKLLCGKVQHKIDVVNWPDRNKGSASVTVAVGYGLEELYLYFQVSESSVLAKKIYSNDPVCEDSCVEMFISVAPDCYYNLEFNCIGTTLMGKGGSRNNRRLLAPSDILRIRRQSTLGSEPFCERIEPTTWQLSVAIPLDLMELQHRDIAGQSFPVNFYKCGNQQTNRHYLSWNPIDACKPNFHRPDHFGLLNAKKRTP